MARQATSLFGETGLRTDRSDLLVRILKIFDGYYGDTEQGQCDPYYKRWNDLCLVLGKPVVIETSSGEIHGRALRIDRRGALIIQDLKGEEQRIVSGDVSLKWEEERVT
jgi:BirA family biotin operon repressor/biotin-[acetyl-CoA-carboxylase] ligase